MAFEYAVVLTGSIATGKSSVAQIFSSFGWKIIDADAIAHMVLDKEHEEITKIFGDEVVENRIVIRKKLGTIIFNNKRKKEALESLLHPLIYNEIVRLSTIEDRQYKPYLIDIPLFFESEHYRSIDKILVVYTSKEEQIKRLMSRDSYNYDEALLRIDSQIDIEVKVDRASYVISNMADKKALENECKKIEKIILKDFL